MSILISFPILLSARREKTASKRKREWKGSFCGHLLCVRQSSPSCTSIISVLLVFGGKKKDVVRQYWTESQTYRQVAEVGSGAKSVFSKPGVFGQCHAARWACGLWDPHGSYGTENCSRLGYRSRRTVMVMSRRTKMVKVMPPQCHCLGWGLSCGGNPIPVGFLVCSSFSPSYWPRWLGFQLLQRLLSLFLKK